MSFSVKEKKTGNILDSIVIANSFFKCLTLSEAMKPFAKHFSLIFKFPLRFKRNLIHMFLMHLHSAHKNWSSIWSHCGPGALKSFQMSLHSWIEIQMLCSVSSRQIWNSRKKSLGHKWEGTDGFRAWRENRRERKAQIIGFFKYKKRYHFKDLIQWMITFHSFKDGRPLPLRETEWAGFKF